jgi:GAF domain-containing protein
MVQQQSPKEPVNLQVDQTQHESPPADPEVPGSDRAHRMLTRLLRVAYPHDGFPDGPYERTATAVQQEAATDAGDDRALSQGLASLDRAADGDFLALGDADVEALLRDRADDYFFVRVRSTAIVALYDDKEVWGLLGYEGSSYEHGGYVDRGFDDLDWLPDPRIEEFDGPPRTELVASEGESA